MMKPKTNYSAKTSPQKDNCQTPPYAVDWLIDHQRIAGPVWEPAPGEGLLARRLRERGIETIATQSDFFTTTPPRTGVPLTMRWLITNPPFSLKYPWLERCYEIGMPFALLMPSDVLFAQRAQNLFNKHGIYVRIPNRRINFKMPDKGWQSSAQMSTSWFIWWPGFKDVVVDFVELKPWKQERVEEWERNVIIPEKEKSYDPNGNEALGKAL